MSSDKVIAWSQLARRLTTVCGAIVCLVFFSYGADSECRRGVEVESCRKMTATVIADGRLAFVAPILVD